MTINTTAIFPATLVDWDLLLMEERLFLLILAKMSEFKVTRKVNGKKPVQMRRVQ